MNDLSILEYFWVSMQKQKGSQVYGRNLRSCFFLAGECKRRVEERISERGTEGRSLEAATETETAVFVVV